MQAGIAHYGRTFLAALTAAVLVFSLMSVFAGTASADHIPSTGPVPDHCVKFDFGTEAEGTTKSPVSFPDVEITLDSWEDEANDPHTVNFTISGLEAGQWVEISTKSGNNPAEEDGPYGNGSHSYTSNLQQAISHVTLCVFEEEPEDTTTTTVEDTTTTTVEDTTTTTVEDTTTTTIEDEVLGTTVTTQAPTTTSIADEVLGTEVLPFTGAENGMLALFAGSLGLLGTLVVMAARRIED